MALDLAPWSVFSVPMEDPLTVLRKTLQQWECAWNIIKAAYSSCIHTLHFFLIHQHSFYRETHAKQAEHGCFLKPAAPWVIFVTVMRFQNLFKKKFRKVPSGIKHIPSPNQSGHSLVDKMNITPFQNFSWCYFNVNILILQCKTLGCLLVYNAMGWFYLKYGNIQ